MNPCTRIAATTSPAVTPRSGKLWTLGGMNTAGLSASCLNLRTLGHGDCRFFWWCSPNVMFVGL